MASGDQPPTSSSFPSQQKLWAQAASSSSLAFDNSPIHNMQILNKIKESTSSFVRVDDDALTRAHMRFQHALYEKLFGKPPPFDQVKAPLCAKWADIGEVFISDLPNGFILIRCTSHLVSQGLLTEGPWSINGIILQLSPWKPFFELTFAKLNSAAIWV